MSRISLIEFFHFHLKRIMDKGRYSCANCCDARVSSEQLFCKQTQLQHIFEGRNFILISYFFPKITFKMLKYCDIP